MAENNIEVKRVDLFKLAELIHGSGTEILFSVEWEIVPIKTNNKLGAWQSFQFLFLFPILLWLKITRTMVYTAIFDNKLNK